MDTKNNWLQWLGIVIPASPVLGYGLAYVRELGYCNFYKIPNEFITLDWTTILVAIAASLGALTLFSWFVIAIIASRPYNISPTRQKFYLSVVCFFFLLIFAIQYLTIQESKQLGIMFLIFLVCIFVLPWVIRNYGTISINRPRVINDTKENKASDSLNRFFNSKYFKYGFLIFYSLAFIFVCSYLRGRVDAMEKQIFYIPSTNPQSVVLKIYGDNIICAPLIQNQHIFEQKYFVIKLSDSNTTITAIQFGYLRPNENLPVMR